VDRLFARSGDGRTLEREQGGSGLDNVTPCKDATRGQRPSREEGAVARSRVGDRHAFTVDDDA
jgi:hypothetical protein